MYFSFHHQQIEIILLVLVSIPVSQCLQCMPNVECDGNADTCYYTIKGTGPSAAINGECLKFANDAKCTAKETPKTPGECCLAAEASASTNMPAKDTMKAGKCANIATELATARAIQPKKYCVAGGPACGADMNACYYTIKGKGSSAKIDGQCLQAANDANCTAAETPKTVGGAV